MAFVVAAHEVELAASGFFLCSFPHTPVQEFQRYLFQLSGFSSTSDPDMVLIHILQHTSATQ